MRSLLLVLLLFGVFTGCDDEEGKTNIIVSEKFTSDNEYLIVCRGFPKKGLTNQIQINATAQDAAVLNAQIYAKEKFPAIDSVREGTIVKFDNDGKSAIVYYLINHKGLKNLK